MPEVFSVYPRVLRTTYQAGSKTWKLRFPETHFGMEQPPSFATLFIESQTTFCRGIGRPQTKSTSSLDLPHLTFEFE